MHEGFGDGAYDMPPLATIQNSGIMWGFGTDGTAANQYLPFTTLYFAVTGKMPGGMKVIRQTISREDALIAHTRKNAFLVFQENNLGSIQPGKLADLVVLDRDYLTIPADQIKDIKPVMTMVGGRVVYDAGTLRPRRPDRWPDASIQSRGVCRRRAGAGGRAGRGRRRCRRRTKGRPPSRSTRTSRRSRERRPTS